MHFKLGQKYSIEETEVTDLQVVSVNVETLRGRSGEAVEMLEHRPVDICCIQEIKFSGKSVRMISGKGAKYKLLWIENKKGLSTVEIFFRQEMGT